MKVLLLCAKAFETMEFSVFIDVMGWARETYMNIKNLLNCQNILFVSKLFVKILSYAKVEKRSGRRF